MKKLSVTLLYKIFPRADHGGHKNASSALAPGSRVLISLLAWLSASFCVLLHCVSVCLAACLSLIQGVLSTACRINSHIKPEREQTRESKPSEEGRKISFNASKQVAQRLLLVCCIVFRSVHFYCYSSVRVKVIKVSLTVSNEIFRHYDA